MHAAVKWGVASLAAWFLIGTASAARAGWPSDSLVNLPICTDPSYQYAPRIVSDGSGGAIITWQDLRNFLDWDIYAQHVDVAGVPKWIPDGIPMCSALGDQTYPVIQSDGMGGAIMTWLDKRDGPTHIYAQRVTGAGTVLWGSDGVAVCTAADLGSPGIASDDSGGAIVAWQDSRSATSFDIYAQRIRADGLALWGPNGIALCTAPHNQAVPQLVPDGMGGAIVTWTDLRGTSQDIYAQRVNSAGTPQWVQDGVALCAAPHDQWGPQIISDGAHGAIVTWYDQRADGVQYDIYAQHVNTAGTPTWTMDGVAVCTAGGNQLYPVIAPDGAGGAIIAWQDQRASNTHIYARRLNSSGTPLWTPDGMTICGAANNQNYPAIAADGAGGAVVTWQDARVDVYGDIYAQRVNPAGSVLWETDGVALCSAAAAQVAPQIAASSSGGAIVVWGDSRNQDGYPTINDDVYAQAVTGTGMLGSPTTSVPPPPILSGVALRLEPNPTRGTLRVSLSLTDDSPARLDWYDLSGRRVESQSVGGLGPGMHELSLAAPASCRSGIYELTLTQSGRSAAARLVVLR